MSHQEEDEEQKEHGGRLLGPLETIRGRLGALEAEGPQEVSDHICSAVSKSHTIALLEPSWMPSAFRIDSTCLNISREPPDNFATLFRALLEPSWASLGALPGPCGSSLRALRSPRTHLQRRLGQPHEGSLGAILDGQRFSY